MTLKQQQARELFIKEVLGQLNEVDKSIDAKGKALAKCLQCYLTGWITGKGGTPDPILYIAVMRGGDPRPEIEDGLKVIAKSIKELSV